MSGTKLNVQNEDVGAIQCDGKRVKKRMKEEEEEGSFENDIYKFFFFFNSHTRVKFTFQANRLYFSCVLQRNTN